MVEHWPCKIAFETHVRHVETRYVGEHRCNRIPEPNERPLPGGRSFLGFVSKTNLLTHFAAAAKGESHRSDCKSYHHALHGYVIDHSTNAFPSDEIEDQDCHACCRTTTESRGNYGVIGLGTM